MVRHLYVDLPDSSSRVPIGSLQRTFASIWRRPPRDVPWLQVVTRECDLDPAVAQRLHVVRAAAHCDHTDRTLLIELETVHLDAFSTVPPPVPDRLTAHDRKRPVDIRRAIAMRERGVFLASLAETGVRVVAHVEWAGSGS